MTDSLWPHGLQQARLPYPPLSPRVSSNSCPLTQWCHPTISSCCPLLLLPSIFPSIRVFSNESALYIRWPKYWSFSFSIGPLTEYSLEGLMLKLQYFGHLMRRGNSLEKTLMLGKTEDRRRRGQQDEIVGWYYQPYGHEFAQTPGIGEGQRRLVGCCPWSHRVRYDLATEQHSSFTVLC